MPRETQEVRARSKCSLQFRMVLVRYQNEQWCLLTDGRQERWVRLFDKSALGALLHNYAYLDAQECLNTTTNGRIRVVRNHRIRGPCLLDRIPFTLRATRGVQQESENSGICWFATMIFVMLFSREMRTLFDGKADKALRSHMKDALVDPRAARRLRAFLYHKYALGDRPNQDPRLDGQNGFSQLCILLARLDIPTTCLFAPSLNPIDDTVVDKRGNKLVLRRAPGPMETSLLVVRCFRTRWIPRARIHYQPDREAADDAPPLRYRLIGLMIGSEYCQHQIAASATDAGSTTWALSDADATRRGIGPLFWSVRRRPGESKGSHMKRWCKMWRQIVPATLFGNDQVCDLNPCNRRSGALENTQDPTDDGIGVVNTDFVYMHIPGVSQKDAV